MFCKGKKVDRCILTNAFFRGAGRENSHVKVTGVLLTGVLKFEMTTVRVIRIPFEVLSQTNMLTGKLNFSERIGTC